MCFIYHHFNFIYPFTILFYPWGIDNPYTRWVVRICHLCAGTAYIVLWIFLLDWYLGFITKGNTYCSYAASSLPLWGNTDVVQATTKGIYGAVAGETSSTSIRFLITNLISLQFTLFSICLSFSSPPLHKNLPFYSPSFSFAFFSSDLFAILLHSHDESRKYQVVWFFQYQ